MSDDAQARSVLFYNPTVRDSSVNLGTKTYKDLDGNRVTGQIALASFSSRILVTDSITQSSTLEGFKDRIDRMNPIVRTVMLRKSIGLELLIFKNGPYEIGLFDARGRLSTRLFEGILSAGRHFFSVNTRSLPMGLSCWAVKTGGRLYSGKVLIAR